MEHTVEPSLSSLFNNDREGELIGMRRGRCAYCGAPIDFDDDNAWHVSYDDEA